MCVFRVQVYDRSFIFEADHKRLRFEGVKRAI